MIAIPDFIRRMRTSLVPRRARSAPEWHVHETHLGFTLAGDTLAVFVLEAKRVIGDPSVVLETWGADRCLDVREVRPEHTAERRWVVPAVYPNLSRDQLDHWRLGSPGGPLVPVTPPVGEPQQRTRLARISTRTIVLPGDPQQLTLRGQRTLHHRDCRTLQWVLQSRLQPVSDLSSVLSMGVHVCRACLPPSP